MTHEPKKSDLAEVAMKPTNKAGLTTAAEPVERRVGTKGNVDQQSTHRTQIRLACHRRWDAYVKQQRSSKGAAKEPNGPRGMRPDVPKKRRS
jgi:RNA-directed DNA polymerase